MKKHLLFILFFISIQAFSQEDAWIYFNQKPNAEFYFANPLQMLSQRALDRRAIQNIALDTKDIPISISFIEQIEAIDGIVIMAKSKWMNAIHVRGSIDAIQSLTTFSFVSEIDFADASLNAILIDRPIHNSRNNAYNKSLQTQTSFSYGNSNNQIEMLNGHLLHEQNYTGIGKIIAVMDAGFPGVNTIQPFERARDNNLILGGYNFVSRNNNIYSADGHGTLVLSSMAGYTENQLVGTAPDAAYYLFITEDIASENPVEESLWVEAAETADSLGVDVINTSLGYFTYQNPNYSYTYEDMDGATSFIARGADLAFSRGMVVVVAAGNSGNSQNPHIATPADAFNVLTVGAVDANQQYASFSSEGNSRDGRVKPDVMAQGLSSVLSDTSGEIIVGSGTSFACPITAGLVACLWQALPEKTNAEIMQLIKASAHLYTNPNVYFGYGIPNFAAALENALQVNTIFENQFLLYPNPAATKVFVHLPKGFEKAEVVFYNSLGQMVLEKPNVSLDINIESLKSGLYFYTLTLQNVVHTGKLLKK